MHNDTNPSFSLNLQTGAYICFSGCGSGGFSSLVERILGCDSNEARTWIDTNGRQTSVDQLSKRLAMELQQPEHPNYMPQDLGWYSRYQLLTDKIMPLWFLERGFVWDTIWHWQIRYDPQLDAVTVPVFWQKEIVGTVTRHIKSNYPKYQNSPKLPKSEILFGMDEINANQNEIILVEGLLDTLWLWQCGYNTAGLLGSELSDKQIEMLQQRKFGEVILALDNDDAGAKGTEEAIRRLTKSGYLLPQITIMRFPEGIKDAQDCDTNKLEQLFEQRKGLIPT